MSETQTPKTPDGRSPDQAAPPGWYQNPQGEGMRYWDGRAWTETMAERPRAAAEPARETSAFAVASLIFGIVGFIIGLGWLLALIFGYIALSQINRSAGRLKGRGMALAGVVLGWVWLAGAVIAAIVTSVVYVVH